MLVRYGTWYLYRTESALPSIQHDNDGHHLQAMSIIDSPSNTIWTTRLSLDLSDRTMVPSLLHLRAWTAPNAGTARGYEDVALAPSVFVDETAAEVESWWAVFEHHHLRARPTSMLSVIRSGLQRGYLEHSPSACAQFPWKGCGHEEPISALIPNRPQRERLSALYAMASVTNSRRWCMGLASLRSLTPRILTTLCAPFWVLPMSFSIC